MTITHVLQRGNCSHTQPIYEAIERIQDSLGENVLYDLEEAMLETEYLIESEENEESDKDEVIADLEGQLEEIKEILGEVNSKSLKGDMWGVIKRAKF